MPIKHFIPIKLWTMQLLLIATMQMHAQDHVPTPLVLSDSVAMIKQLLQNQFIQQLKQNTLYNRTDAAYLKKLVSDSLAMDSLGKMVLDHLKQTGKTVLYTGTMAISDDAHAVRQALQQRLGQLLQTQQIKNVIAEFTGILKQPLLQWKTGLIQLNGQYGAWHPGTDNALMSNVLLHGNWLIAGVPVNMQLLRQDFNGQQTYSRNSFSFQFDKGAYLNSLRDKINIKINRDNLLNQEELLLQVRQGVVSRFKQSLDSISGFYRGKWDSVVNVLANAGDIVNTNETTLREKLEKIFSRQNAVEYKAILLQAGQGDSTNNSFGHALSTLPDAERIDKIIKLVDSYKTELQPVNLLKAGNGSESSAEQQAAAFIKDPEQLKAVAKDQLNLNGIQKLLLNISQLKMGVHTVCLSPLSINQYTNNGVSASLYNNNKFLFVMAGRQAGAANPFGVRPGIGIFSSNNSGAGLTIGKGELTTDHIHLGVFSYQHGRNEEMYGIAGTMPGRTIVATLSTQFTFGETSHLALEISKTTHSYNNQESTYDTLQGNAFSKKSTVSEHFFDQLAFALQWNGSMEQQHLAYDVHVSKTGKAYNNPGSPFVINGLTELGGSLRKNLLNDKLQLGAKLNYRDYQFSANNNRWMSYNFSLQARWKLKKGQFIALRYQPYYTMHRQNDGVKATVINNRFSIEGSFRKRFGNINYQHSLSLSLLQSRYAPDSMSLTNKTIDWSSMQSFSINKHSFYISALYSRAGLQLVNTLSGDQFNVELGSAYNICKSVTGSTAAHYNSARHWYRQAGIKQSIGGQIGERFIITVYAYLYRQLKLYQPLYMGNTNFNWSLQYILK